MQRGLLGCLVLGVVGNVLAAPQPDPARFAPNKSWSYAIPAKPPAAAATPTRDQMIEDIAYLQHALEEAWAWSSRSTIDSFRSLPARLHRIPFAARDAQAMCDALAMELRNTGIGVALGAPCGRATPHDAVGVLDTVPADRNYGWRIDRAADHGVGILTISKLADPQDPGWTGLVDAMKELSATDLVIVDLQHAGGDDPRAGFAVVAALGLEDYTHTYLRPPSFRNGPIAKVARENARVLVPNAVAPRSWPLWASFAAEADIRRIAREVVPGITRKARVSRSMRMLVGPDCERACQLVVGLVRWQGVDLYGSFEDASGDEPGAIRLVHSGIVVTFPTASYGPYVIGPLEHRSLPPDHAKTLLVGMHAIGHARAESIAWRTRPLPTCSTLPIDRSLVHRKTSGCLPHPLPARMLLPLSLSVEAVTAERFLKTCTGLTVASAMDAGDTGSSMVTVSGSIDAIAQALAAPFQVHASWGCKPRLY